VQNWFSGETMRFRRTGADSAGEVIELDLELRPLGAPGGAPHRHVVAERYEFTSGRALVWIAGSPPRLVRSGDFVDVPPNRWHFIVALERTSATVSIRPAMRFDELLVEWAAIGRGDFRPKRIQTLIRLLSEHSCL
jgi:mannose-6-phosphate isomerase-like protein (cupin superfamily)